MLRNAQPVYEHHGRAKEGPPKLRPKTKDDEEGGKSEDHRPVLVGQPAKAP